MFNLFIGYAIGSSDSGGNSGGGIFQAIIGLVGLFVLFQIGKGIYALFHWFEQIAVDGGILSFVFFPYIFQSKFGLDDTILLLSTIAINVLTFFVIYKIEKRFKTMEKNFGSVLVVAVLTIYVYGLLFRQTLVGGSYLFETSFFVMLGWFFAHILILFTIHYVIKEMEQFKIKKEKEQRIAEKRGKENDYLMGKTILQPIYPVKESGLKFEKFYRGTSYEDSTGKYHQTGVAFHVRPDLICGNQMVVQYSVRKFSTLKTELGIFEHSINSPVEAEIKIKLDEEVVFTKRVTGSTKMENINIDLRGKKKMELSVEKISAENGNGLPNFKIGLFSNELTPLEGEGPIGLL